MSHPFVLGATGRDYCWFQDDPDSRGRGITCGLPAVAHDPLLSALAPLDLNARMEAYYYTFDRTGIGAVDQILSEVAIAGKAHHSTEEWIEPYEDGRTYAGSDKPHVDRIQRAAQNAADLITQLVNEIRELRSR